MHIATRPGDLSATASMSEEGVRPSEHEHVGTFIVSQNSQDGIREVKKSAFEITNVQVDNDNEDLEASQLHNKTIGEDDNPTSPLSSDMLAASTPSKQVSNKDTIQSASTLPVVASTTTVLTTINGPPHLHGSRFRKVNDYVRERWKVTDSLEVDADEHSDISEPRNVIQKVTDIPSNSSSPSTTRRNHSLDVASSSNLSDARSDYQSDEATRNEGATLTEVSSVVASRRASTDFSQDDIASTDDNYESYSQGTPSETNVKIDTESNTTVEIPSIIRGSAEIIKSEALKIIDALKNVESLEGIISENTRLKRDNETLRKENERLKKENDKLQADIKQPHNSVAQQTSTSAIQS